MARSEVFKTVRVRGSIWELLEPLLETANKGQFRPMSMNAYIEMKLWEVGTGKLIYGNPQPVEALKGWAEDSHHGGHGARNVVPEGHLKGASVRKPRSASKSVDH